MHECIINSWLETCVFEGQGMASEAALGDGALRGVGVGCGAGRGGGGVEAGRG